MRFNPDIPIYREMHRKLRGLLSFDRTLRFLEIGAFPGQLLWYFSTYFGYQVSGLCVIAAYAASGFDSLTHYVLAPFEHHSVAMNLTIWFQKQVGGRMTPRGALVNDACAAAPRAFFVLSLAAGCNQRRDLALGQIWSYDNRRGEGRGLSLPVLT